MAAFIVADLLAITLISGAVVWLVGRDAAATAVRNARDLTVAEGRAAVWPLLSDGLLDGDAPTLARLDATVRARVLSAQIVRVKVWSADGTILYSDETRLIGIRFPLGTDERAAMTTGRPHADVSDLTQPENVYERPFRKLLEVYDGLHTPSGRAVLFEAYIRFSSVSDDSHRTVISLVPVVLAGLLLLFLAQIPLAWTMARRLEHGQVEERRLLRQAMTAAEIERRHIAADLHDGSVQALAGTALSLTAAAEDARKAGLPTLATQVADAAAGLRQGIRELRTLIVAIAPPRLHDEGLTAALEDLLSPLRARGVDVNVAVEGDSDLPPDMEALTYRVAQEAVRNVARHAGGATRVTVDVTRRSGCLRLEVADDGPGFTLAELEGRRSDGHLGLHLLADLVSDAGGHLDVSSVPGNGARVTLEVPVQ